MGKAIPMAVVHWRAFRSFSAGLEAETAVSLKEWERDIREWDEDMTKPSPYVLPDEGAQSRMIPFGMAKDRGLMVRCEDLGS